MFVDYKQKQRKEREGEAVGGGIYVGENIYNITWLIDRAHCIRGS